MASKTTTLVVVGTVIVCYEVPMLRSNATLMDFLRRESHGDVRTTTSFQRAVRSIAGTCYLYSESPRLVHRRPLTMLVQNYRPESLAICNLTKLLTS